MPSDPAVADRLIPPVARPSFLALRDRPDAIHRLRQFAGSTVFGLPFLADEVELVAVEVVTNALHAVRHLDPQPYDLWPIGVELTATHRYAHLAVSDPDGRRMAAASEGGLEAEHGRGLPIVDHLAVARWVVYFEHGKTVNVVIAASGIELTAEELKRIGAPA